MKPFPGVAAAIAALLIAGCSAKLVRERPVKVACMDGLAVETAPAVERLARLEGVKVQHLQGEWKGRTFEAQAVMKGEGGKFKLALLAPQMRLLTVTVTPPFRLEWERARQLPEAFEPEYALFDLACANLAKDELSAALAPDLLVKEEGSRRTIFEPGGRIATTVDFGDDGTIRLENPVRGYSYTITTL